MRYSSVYLSYLGKEGGKDGIFEDVSSITLFKEPTILTSREVLRGTKKGWGTPRDLSNLKMTMSIKGYLDHSNRARVLFDLSFSYISEFPHLGAHCPMAYKTRRSICDRVDSWTNSKTF